jgi:hypothetical protein
MKKKRCSFSGFQPSNSDTGIASLDDFQKRIVELEMKKRALAVRFRPRSREITAIQREIAGVRHAMRERISEHLQFLQNKREGLLAKKIELESARPRTGIATAGSTGDSPGESPDGGKSAPVQDGLYLLEKPHVSHVPLTASAGDRINRLFFGVSSGAKAAVGWTQQELGSFPFTCSIDIPSYHVQDRPDETNETMRSSSHMTELIKDKLAAVAKELRRRVETRP